MIAKFGFDWISHCRASVAVVKSRDLHWGLLATKDHKEISLSSIRLLLVADGANPWSLSSCDQFLSVFQAKGTFSSLLFYGNISIGFHIQACVSMQFALALAAVKP
jgi:hypothetical protein